ncbi:hypothetical protein CASFOL_016887 [Castilleja foliolosa]|uniref:F-box domain-containing protein n=1 Tax=Castilleja foliolosa TaxID=1961234 RepID=A0ABD3DDN5_9LAMI
MLVFSAQSAQLDVIPIFIPIFLIKLNVFKSFALIFFLSSNQLSMNFPYHFPINIIRHPPRRSTANQKAAEKVITGQQTGDYCLRMCKKRKCSIMSMDSSSSSLPDDMWFQILAQLPAKDIYDLARLVCWNWYRIIYTHTFIYTNLQYTPYGLLFKCKDMPIFVTMKQGRIETSMFNAPFSPSLWATSNGLMVTREPRTMTIYYIANPLTKQVFVLPPTIGPTSASWLCGIGYAPVLMEYKVVVTNMMSNGPWGIITPGVDTSWRPIQTDHLGFLRWISRPPLITEGFMHWTFDGSCSEKKIGNQVLTLDLETEIVTKSCVPLSYDEDFDHWKYLSTGKCITVLITLGKCLWEVWEMKSGEWRKLEGVVIDLGTQMFEQYGFELVPIGWLKYLGGARLARSLSFPTSGLQFSLQSGDQGN